MSTISQTIATKHTATIQQPPIKTSSIQNIQANANTDYQLLDKTGNVAKNTVQKVVEDDLWVYFEDNLTQIPDVIFHGYEEFLPAINATAMPVANTLPAVEMVSATTQASANAAGVSSFLGKALLGTAAIGGGVAIASSGGSKSTDTPTSNNANNNTNSNTNTGTTTPVTPTSPITASLTIDPISTVNKQASEDNITITGTLSVSNATNTTVSVTVNGTSHTATITGNTWQVDVVGTALAHAQGTQTITAKITASNSTDATSNTANTSYTVDTIAPAATVVLNDILGSHNVNNLLNKADMDKGEITITGTVNNLAGADTLNRVILTIDGKTYDTTITGTSYSAVIKTAELVNASSITATATVTDAVGNVQTTSNTPKTYTIDTTAPVATIALNNITADNKLSLDEINAGGNTTITGKVSGEFNDGDEITVKVGTTEYPATVNSNGDFSVAVPVATLQANTAITASFSTVDNAGNPSAAINTSKTYTVETTSPVTPVNPTPTNPVPVNPAPTTNDLKIAINDITADNLINVTEANAQITVTGTVTGADKLATGQTVALSLNGTVVQANVAVGTDGTFSTTISGTQLANTPNYTITATATGNNNATATIDKKYTVAANVAAKVDITAIDDDFSTDIAEADGMVRLTGKATFAGDYAQTGAYNTQTNAQLVRQVEIKIGNQTHTAGVRNGEFYLDIKRSELAALSGQSLSYTFKAEPWKFDNTSFNGIRNLVDNQNSNPESYVTVTADKVEITSPYTTTTGNNTTINAIAADSTTVSGTVSGAAKAGDIVTLSVNNKTYTATVNNNKTFSTTIVSSELNADSDHTITATLATKDLAGNAITVSDSEHYASTQKTAADYVSENTFLHRPDEYFVSDLGALGFIKYSVLANRLQNDTAVIKYYFSDKNSYDKENFFFNTDEINKDSVANHPDTLKTIIRGAYNQIAEYANVRFEEVDNYDDADMRLYYAEFKNDNPNQGVTVAFVADKYMFWNSAVNNNDNGKTYTALHEISHMLGMEHSSDTFTGIRNYEESSEFTYMSYRAAVNNGLFENLANLRIYDLAYLHYQLGVNKTARAGNDTYTFQDYDMYSDDAGRYIWDGNGIDTFDASAETQGVTVDLTPGSWIYVGEKSENFLVNNQAKHQPFTAQNGTQFIDNTFYNGTYTVNDYTKGQAYIGYDTQIENLIGSAHSDTLTGNNADNIIFGGAGNDTINGGAGDDYLDGGTGADRMTGGTGDDTYIVDNIGDVVIELANQGMDTVISSVNYTLGDNVEHLTLIGTVATTATGNALANTLTANNIGNTLNGGAGNDILIGGLGADTLTGGAGNDSFVFSTALNSTIDTITDFMQAGTDTLVLASDVFTSLSKSSVDNVLDFISYDKATGVLAYDSDGSSGIIDAIAFANIGTGLEIDKSHFTII
ncbi:MAG: Ig-like domain-containing protein [Moraxella sp.]|nr:Ig-like domain-containing protein [Moraxella sp.]